MSASERFQSTETRRGGCLDAAVKVVSFGMFGLETTIDSTNVLSLDRFVINDEGEEILVDDPASITRRVFETGETVIFNSGVDDSPRIKRRIVRNRSNE